MSPEEQERFATQAVIFVPPSKPAEPPRPEDSKDEERSNEPPDKPEEA